MPHNQPIGKSTKIQFKHAAESIKPELMRVLAKIAQDHNVKFSIEHKPEV